MATIVADDALALQRLYHWERTAPDQVALTQPMGGGVVRDYHVARGARPIAPHGRAPAEPGAAAWRPDRHLLEEHVRTG